MTAEHEEPYRPRANDHLVEPMFAGLGVGEGEDELENGSRIPGHDVGSSSDGTRGWFARLWSVLARR